MRRLSVALGAAVVLLVLATFASAAPPATVTGKLTGAVLPGAGEGRVPVWAVRLSDGVVADSTFATPSGRIALQLPRGSYALLAAVIAVNGRAEPLVRVADFLTIKPGKRLKIRPTLKKRRKDPRRATRLALSTARVAFVQVDHPAIWAQNWVVTGDDAELKALQAGMNDLMIVDLVNGFQQRRCDAVVVERDRLADIIVEIKLQQSKYFDPATRVKPGQLIAANGIVSTTLDAAGGQLTMTATYVDQRTGRTGTASVSGPTASLFDLIDKLSAQVVSVICDAPPRRYSGTFAGSWTTDLNTYKVTWTGEATLELQGEDAPVPEGAPPGVYARYSVAKGHARFVLDGTRNASGTGEQCTVHGEAEFDLTTGVDAAAVQTGEQQPSYTLLIPIREDAQIPYTETGPGCNQVNPSYPLTGVLLVYTETPLRATDPAHLTGNTSWNFFNGTSHFTSQFALTAAG